MIARSSPSRHPSDTTTKWATAPSIMHHSPWIEPNTTKSSGNVPRFSVQIQVRFDLHERHETGGLFLQTPTKNLAFTTRLHNSTITSSSTLSLFQFLFFCFYDIYSFIQSKMVQSSVLGFPRMGANRDLKKATEAYWGGKLSMEELLKEGKRLRLEHWTLQKTAGVDIIPSNDFAYYDHVLDHIQLFNVSLRNTMLPCTYF